MALQKENNFDMSSLTSTINELVGKCDEKDGSEETKSASIRSDEDRRRSFELALYINDDKRLASMNAISKRRQSYPGYLIPSLPPNLKRRTCLQESNILCPRYGKLRKTLNIARRFPKVKVLDKPQAVSTLTPEKNTFERLKLFRGRPSMTSYCTEDVIKALKIVQSQKRSVIQSEDECSTPIKKKTTLDDISPKGLLDCTSPTDTVSEILSSDMALQTVINTKSNSIRAVKIQRVPLTKSKIKPDQVKAREPSRLRWNETLNQYDTDATENNDPKLSTVKPIIKKVPQEEFLQSEPESKPVVKVQSKIFSIVYQNM